MSEDNLGKDQPISRRDFIKKMGIASVSLIAAPKMHELSKILEKEKVDFRIVNQGDSLRELQINNELGFEEYYVKYNTATTKLKYRQDNGSDSAMTFSQKDQPTERKLGEILLPTLFKVSKKFNKTGIYPTARGNKVNNYGRIEFPPNEVKYALRVICQADDLGVYGDYPTEINANYNPNSVLHDEDGLYDVPDFGQGWAVGTITKEEKGLQFNVEGYIANTNALNIVS